MNIDELRDYNKIILRLGLEKHSKSVRLSSLGVEGWSIEDHHSISDITTIIEQADRIKTFQRKYTALRAELIELGYVIENNPHITVDDIYKMLKVDL